MWSGMLFLIILFSKIDPPEIPLIASFMGPTWGPSGADRTQVGPMLAPWTLLSGTCQVILGMAGWIFSNSFISLLSFEVPHHWELLPGDTRCAPGDKYQLRHQGIYVSRLLVFCYWPSPWTLEYLASGGRCAIWCQRGKAEIAPSCFMWVSWGCLLWVPYKVSACNTTKT